MAAGISVIWRQRCRAEGDSVCRPLLVTAKISGMVPSFPIRIGSWALLLTLRQFRPIHSLDQVLSAFLADGSGALYLLTGTAIEFFHRTGLRQDRPVSR